MLKLRSGSHTNSAESPARDARGRRSIAAVLAAMLGLCAVPAGATRAESDSTRPVQAAGVETAGGRIVDAYREEDARAEGASKAPDSRPEWVEEALALSVAQLGQDREKALHKLRDASQDLRLRSAVRDDLGQTHLRLTQLHNGVEVFGGQLVSHLKGGPEPEIGGRTFDVLDVDTTPTIDAGQAVEAAKTAHGLTGQLASEPETKLFVLPHQVFETEETDEATLCWRVTLQVEDQDEASGSFYYFVDAKDGSIVWRQDACIHGTGTGVYCGNVPVGSVKNVSASNYTMVDPAHGNSKVFNYNNMAKGTYTFGFELTDADDVWGDTTMSNPQTVAVDAQFGVAKTWDYFAGNYGWRGMTGTGGAVYSNVKVGTNVANASYDSATNQLYFYDGNWSDPNKFPSWPFVTVDVVGHEFTHGVTRFTAGLGNMNEPGALNESFSDIFGTAVETTFKGGRQYMMAEDCGPRDCRSMDNPPGTIEGDDYTQSGQPGRDYYPNRYIGSWDNGGVHINAGIMNKAFYLLAEGGTHPTTYLAVSGIGRTSAERIFYRALTSYLFPTAGFYDARVATMNAAVDLFGPGSVEVNAVENAWDAVGVTGANLFFYRDTDGAAATAQITIYGTFSQLAGYSPGSFSTYWSNVVATRQGLFFYKSSTGDCAVGRTGLNGGVTTIGWNYLPRNFTDVVSSANGILLYNRSDRSGMVVQIDGSGSINIKQNFGPGAFGYWTKIVDTPGGIFFYSSWDGSTAVCRIGPNGSWTQTDGSTRLTATNFEVVAMGKDVLLYNQYSGAYELGTVDTNGRFNRVIPTYCAQVPIGTGYDTIVKHKGDVFFYNSQTGAARVGRRGACGFTFVRDYPAYSFGLYWGKVVSTANGLFFYNGSNGAAAVGFFDAYGNFYQTAGYGPGSFGTYWKVVMRMSK